MDERWMGEALREARIARKAGEVPVGAVVVKGGEVIGRGRNAVERSRLATAHAEMLAIEDAARTLGDWRLDGCTIYITVEPCHMCLGALYLSRISRVVFGARQSRSGACGSVDSFHEAELFNHHIDITCGVRAEECLALMREFFGELRLDDKARRDARAG